MFINVYKMFVIKGCFIFTLKINTMKKKKILGKYHTKHIFYHKSTFHKNSCSTPSTQKVVSRIYQNKHKYKIIIKPV